MTSCQQFSTFRCFYCSFSATRTSATVSLEPATKCFACLHPAITSYSRSVDRSARPNLPKLPIAHCPSSFDKIAHLSAPPLLPPPVYSLVGKIPMGKTSKRSNYYVHLGTLFSVFRVFIRASTLHPAASQKRQCVTPPTLQPPIYLETFQGIDRLSFIILISSPPSAFLIEYTPRRQSANGLS